MVSLFLQSMWCADAAPGTTTAILPPCGKAVWVHSWHTEEDRSHTLPECKAPDLTAPKASPITPLYCLIISSKLKSYWHTVLMCPQPLVESLIHRLSFICSSRSTLPLCSLLCASWGWTVLTTSIGILASTFNWIWPTGSTATDQSKGGRRRRCRYLCCWTEANWRNSVSGGFSVPWAFFCPFIKNLLKWSNFTKSSVSCWAPG